MMRNFLQQFTARCHKHTRPAYEVAIDNGDNAEAIPLLLAEARHLDARALVTLGVMMLLGKGIEQNDFDGVAWIRQGAVRGETRGMMVLGSALSSGLGCTRDEGEAVFWLYKAAQTGLGGDAKALTQCTDALASLLLRNPSLMGLHFSLEDFQALMRRAHRPTPAH